MDMTKCPSRWSGTRSTSFGEHDSYAVAHGPLEVLNRQKVLPIG